MRTRMIDELQGSAQRERSSSSSSGLQIIDTPTSLNDCSGRQLRFRRSNLRTLVECMVPACCAFPSSPESVIYSSDTDSLSTVTGTFFGHRKGRVSFCIQDHNTSSPLILLEFAVPTSYLAREMQHGLLRIALECDRHNEEGGGCRPCSLYNVPVWCMYCNGRKVGFAVRRQMTTGDAKVLKLMQSVSVGAGLLPVALNDDHDGEELMYLRASFDRVIGSPDSESFHMINPVGSSAQELSVK
ncbi:hypothetical protein BUALT_Bualt11G0007500 [Buddleja alternifolia]|uniref:Protein MIZU-KUSSEI 1 n=1 Tax=Buddleja alternifolia TaxID=168488 RepID=A0AAV6WRR9_9LAMI|nr:hypothetical protein BUALT_Bualt11G0007500 [Buddleja alternifolia]